MDGPSVQGFVSLTGPLAPKVADCRRRVMFASFRGQGERFLGLTGLMAGGFLGLTALQAEGCGGGFAADYKVSVTGLAFYVIWHSKHSGN